MISAGEARKKQNELNTQLEDEQLKKIEDNINKDIKQGYTYFSGRLYPTVSEELRKLGYEVKYNFDQRDGDFTTISW